MRDRKTLDANHFSPDVTEFVFLLHKHRVRYLLIGGEAVIFYGHARLTGDVDFFYDDSESNAKALYKALLDFWENNIPEMTDFRELREPGLILQFGLPPNRIDLLNKISGIDFNGAREQTGTAIRYFPRPRRSQWSGATHIRTSSASSASSSATCAGWSSAEFACRRGDSSR